MQILKENKDKKDAEFNERFKHSKFKCLLVEVKPLAYFLCVILFLVFFC